MSETRYLLFPIELLQEIDIRRVCSNAFTYGIYRKALDFLERNETTVAPKHIQQAMEYFNLTVNNLQNRVNNGKELHDTFSVSNPMVSINTSLLLQFCNEEKTDFEILTFRAYCAIRSILGVKPCCKVKNDYLLARMYGFRKVDEYQVRNTLTLNRYQLDKIKLELQKNWGLIYYSRQTRGFYVSFTIALETLILHVERNRETCKAKELKQKKDEAYQKAMQKLKKPP